MALRVHTPKASCARYPEGAPVLIWGAGGYEAKGIKHGLPPETKPHIHQAWDGFRHTAGLWVRMNPDLAYVRAINAPHEAGFPDNPANSEPTDWHNIRPWGFPPGPGRVREDVWLASVAEMADRVRAGNWGANLDGVLVEPIMLNCRLAS